MENKILRNAFKEDPMGHNYFEIHINGDAYNHVDQVIKKYNDPPHEEMAPHDAFREVVKTLIQQNLITHKQDFGILYQLEMEMNCLGTDNYVNMIKLIVSVIDIPHELIPTINSFKGLVENVLPYPNWQFGALPVGTISHKKSVANAYIREMEKHGYSHPSVIK